MKVIRGRNYRRLSSKDFPHAVDVDRDGNDAWTREYKVDISHKTGEPFRVSAVDFFFGHDFGDHFEMGVTIWGDVKERESLRYFVARRIEEDTAPGGEAGVTHRLPEALELAIVKVLVICRVTGANDDVHKGHPSHRKWRANFDLSLILIGE